MLQQCLTACNKSGLDKCTNVQYYFDADGGNFCDLWSKECTLTKISIDYVQAFVYERGDYTAPAKYYYQYPFYSHSDDKCV